MNEEFEKEQLGGLPYDIQIERGELPTIQHQIVPTPTSGGGATNAMNRRESRVKTSAQNAGTMPPPRFKADVQSTFPVRPVNAVDDLFGGTLELRVPA